MRAVSSGIRSADEICKLSAQDVLTEYLMLRLRLKRGISFSDYYRRFGADLLKIFKEPISFSISNGLITQDEYGIYPTLKGFDLQNALITEFMKII